MRSADSTTTSRRAWSAAFASGALMILALAGAAALVAENEPQIQATVRLDPAVAGLGELVSLTITVESGGFGGVEVTPTFELDNLEIVSGPFQSRSQRWVNGQTSSSVQLAWRLRPTSLGRAGVRAIRIAADGQTLELADRVVDILKQAPAGRAPVAPSRRNDPFEDFFASAFPDARAARKPAPSRAPKIRLEAEVVPADPYVGQQATYTLWLYTQSDISAFQPTKVPDFRGFWVREIPQPSELRPEWVDIDGERFGRVPMLRRAIFPLQEGRFTFEPTEVDVVARIAEIGPFGSPFGRNETLHLKTGPAAITARPLPPAPSGGTGLTPPVGDITLSARLDRATLEVGQAATLTVRCTGRGNLQSLSPLELDLPEGLTGFPPRQESTDRLTDGALVSSTEWSYVIVPERPGSFEIPGLSLTYFDPAQRTYRTASAKPARLAVTGEPVAVAAKPPVEPVVEAKESAPQAEVHGFSRYSTGIWAGAVALGLVLVPFVVFRTLRGPARAARSASSRSLKSAIAHAAQAPTPRAAAAALEEAWRQHLSDRWRIPPSAPVSSWTEKLLAENADPSAAQALAELAHELHYLRYAPELSAADHLLADALDTSRRLARSLR